MKDKIFMFLSDLITYNIVYYNIYFMPGFCRNRYAEEPSHNFVAITKFGHEGEMGRWKGCKQPVHI